MPRTVPSGPAIGSMLQSTSNQPPSARISRTVVCTVLWLVQASVMAPSALAWSSRCTWRARICRVLPFSAGRRPTIAENAGDQTSWSPAAV
jgi:hypothetical protein